MKSRNRFKRKVYFPFSLKLNKAKISNKEKWGNLNFDIVYRGR